GPLVTQNVVQLVDDLGFVHDFTPLLLNVRFAGTVVLGRQAQAAVRVIHFAKKVSLGCFFVRYGTGSPAEVQCEVSCFNKIV
ncbi:MAG: hypothetical protein KDA59_02915, partial [Planctomycetales bacterium]|nr:hypothetical protein [Planctomycetales bacterium]